MKYICFFINLATFFFPSSGFLQMLLPSRPPTASEAERILHLAKYNVFEGSWSNTRTIYVGEVLVGFYVVWRDYLHFLHIFKKYRRRGFGLTAVGFLTASVPNLYLHATPSARVFWERCGFKTRDFSDRGCVEMRFQQQVN
jgi:GNAT superfamily N-acetyltransferase